MRDAFHINAIPSSVHGRGNIQQDVKHVISEELIELKFRNWIYHYVLNDYVYNNPIPTDYILCYNALMPV